MTLKLTELEHKRNNDHLRPVRELAAKAESEGRGFTDAEDAAVKSHLAKAEELNGQISRVKSVSATGDQIAKLLGEDDASDGGGDIAGTKAVTGAATSELSRRFSKALFGGGVNVDKSNLSGGRPTDFDGFGYDRSQKASAFTSTTGRVTVPVMRRPDNGSVMLLPEFGAATLGLYQDIQLTSGDTYKIRRQTAIDHDSAEFVPLLAQKPESDFDFTVEEDRVRTIAVLSKPMAIQDLKDVPALRDDVADYLARRVIWKLENATLNGDSAIDAESFDGILNTTGVLDQTYNVSPARTIRRSITRLTTSGHLPETLAIAMHPDAWEDIETAEDNDGRPLYPNLYTTRQEPILYGTKVVLTDKLAAESAVIGNWRYGGLTIRDHIELSWTDGGDLFEINAVKFRAEMRAGFNLAQPSAFIHAALQAG